MPYGQAQGTAEDYKRAEQFLPGNLRHHLYVADVVPHWIGKTSRFWYRKSGLSGVEFLLVDPTQTATSPAFDHARIAAALSKESKQAYTATELPFDSFEFSDDMKSIHFKVESGAWSCDLEKYECKAKHEPGDELYEEASPDKQWVAFIKDYNLFVRYIPTGESVQLTRDGEAGWAYASEIASLRPMVTQGTQDLKQSAAVFWSPDSSTLVTYRMDTRNAGRFTNVQFVPPDQLRPRAFSVVYPLPGEALPKAEPIVFDVRSGKRTDVKTPPIEMQFQGGPEFEWFPDSKSFYYRAEDRGEKAIEVRVVNPETGEQKTLIREAAKNYVDPGETWIHFLHDSGEFVWSSERDGWNHLYLYNQKTGELKNQITQGEWVVRQIVDVDEKARRIYFLAGGREKNEDPYQTHLYSAGLDGKNLTLLTPENATHITAASPDHLYFVDNASRPDLPAESALRNLKDGSQVRVLEKTDPSEVAKSRLEVSRAVPRQGQGRLDRSTTA